MKNNNEVLRKQKYANKVLELFSCYGEIINYDKYVSIDDIKNKVMVQKILNNICKVFYTLL